MGQGRLHGGLASWIVALYAQAGAVKARLSCILFAVVKCDHGGRARPSPALVRKETAKSFRVVAPTFPEGRERERERARTVAWAFANEEPASARMGRIGGRREPEQ